MTAAEALDHTPWTRGKYRGKTASEVAEIDPSYLIWAWSAWDEKPCSHLLFKECQRDVEDNRQQMRVAREQDE